MLTDLWQMHQQSPHKLMRWLTLVVLHPLICYKDNCSISAPTRKKCWAHIKKLVSGESSWKRGFNYLFLFFNTYWISSCNLRQHFSLVVYPWDENTNIQCLAQPFLQVFFWCSTSFSRFWKCSCDLQRTKRFSRGSAFQGGSHFLNVVSSPHHKSTFVPT